MDCDSAQKLIQQYIERKLDGEELEMFLEHVKHCESCSEELEVFYMVYYALKQLDSDDACYDITHLMQADIQHANEYLDQCENRRFFGRVLKLFAAVCLLVFVGIGIEAVRYGGIANTKAAQYLREELEITETNSETEEQRETSQTEPETNHKKEVIVKNPETEAFTEPGLIPDAP